MRTKTIELYTIGELDDGARERAIDRVRRLVAGDPAWDGESRDSIKTFADHFGVTLVDWSVGAFSPIHYRHDATNDTFRGLRLTEFDREAMPTGYCLDADLWQTFYDRFKETGSAKIAFDGALDAGFRAWRADMEWQMSDEYLTELAEINDWEFTETGAMA